MHVDLSLRVALAPIVMLCVGLLGCSDDVDPNNTGGAGGTAGEGGAGGAGETPPVELSPNLCEDPSLMQELVGALGSGSDPTYGMVNLEQAQKMMMNPTEGPFYMVNLIRFREQAMYPDGRESDLTGREANDLYSAPEFISQIGARIVFVGEVSGTTDGAADTWEQVAIVEYPCPLALFAMSAHPDFQATSIHKEAGVEASLVIVTNIQPLPDPIPTQMPFPSTADDPAFAVVNLLSLREQAQYPSGSSEPDRSGQEAIDLYAQSIAAAEAQVGITPTARFDVDGVFIGDGRVWDGLWIDAVPSQAAWDALTTDTAFVDAQVHRDAAVEDAYGLNVDSLIVDIPDASP